MWLRAPGFNILLVVYGDQTRGVWVSGEWLFVRFFFFFFLSLVRLIVVGSVFCPCAIYILMFLMCIPIFYCLLASPDAENCHLLLCTM